jgi:type IV pilus assembly protein PilW
MRNVRTVRSHAGFTLPELLVAVIVGLLVLAGVHRVFMAGLKTHTTASLQAEVNRKAQVAMDDLLSLLRSSSGVADGNAERIWFVDQDDNNVRYWVDAGKLYRYRGVAEGSYSGGTVAASNVSSIVFQYYDVDGQPAVPSEAAKVAVEMGVEHAYHSAHLTSAVKLRNK